MAVSRRAFLMTGAAAGAAAVVRPLAAAGTGPAPGRGMPMGRPNIVLLMADQMRGDCVGADGNSAIRTPNLDRLARDGALFTRAYSSTPSCTPARAALLTGCAPWRHGMLAYGRIAERYPFEFPQALRGAGYYTMGIGKMHYHPQRNKHGFHETILDESGRVESPEFKSDYRAWFQTMAPGENPDATGIGWNDYPARPYALPEELHPTRWTADTAVRFIHRYERPDPFFLKVSFARPHSPYDPPGRFWTMYEGAPLPAAPVGQWAAPLAERSGKADDIWHGDLGLAQVRTSRQGYYGSISFVDEQIGRVLDALDARGRLDDTLILFVSDHGDMTGDHHLWRKTYAYEGSARVPLIVRWPTGMVSAARGSTVAAPVEIRDIAPTFMAAAGLDAGDRCDGRSLLALLSGKPVGWRPWIDLEHSLTYNPDNNWNALTDGHWKYVFHARDGHEQLFNLDRDPKEVDDLAGRADAAAALARWRDRLIEHLAPRGGRYVSGGKLARRPDGILYSPNYPG